jgi:hypothetical protein
MAVASQTQKAHQRRTFKKTIWVFSATLAMEISKLVT